MHVLSVNIGPLRTIEVKGKAERTGIFKTPTRGAQRVGVDGFEDDVLVETRKAGRAHHAVYAYPHEHYGYWAERLGREPFPHGHFGENLTTLGFPETGARVGDVVRCGTAVLQVAQPRIPCRKLNAKMGLSFGRMFVESRRVGFYLRVLEPGSIEAGDRFEILQSDPGGPTIDDFVRIAKLDYWDAEGLARLLSARDLVPLWREKLEASLERARAADGWLGLRELEVTSRRRESEEVVSFQLRCPLGRELPPFRAGQYLTVAVRPGDERHPLRRAYAISSDPADLSAYRITVRRLSAQEGKPEGVVSSYLHRALAVGDRMRVAAPRGFFTLERVLEPHQRVALVAEGVAIAPVLSILHAWAGAEDKPRTTIVHCCRDGAHHPSREDVERLAQRHERLDILFAYGEPSAEDRSRENHHIAGVVDGGQLIERCGADPHFFLAGSSGFVTRLSAELTALGVPAERLQEERFGRM